MRRTILAVYQRLLLMRRQRLLLTCVRAVRACVRWVDVVSRNCSISTTHFYPSYGVSGERRIQTKTKIWKKNIEQRIECCWFAYRCCLFPSFFLKIKNKAKSTRIRWMIARSTRMFVWSILDNVFWDDGSRLVSSFSMLMCVTECGTIVQSLCGASPHIYLNDVHYYYYE